ncbi:hypothetical protein HPB51_029784 [Rhipicephalus microplus]|uniref:Uncharacterized protein n=1 Tax=Rhipicephalus microplus TaxID=6941 RepID=A0A9J6CTG9_RHIMP|nr:hypothetical protein HPB51_029784 [Rhipicephalus microplus]
MSQARGIIHIISMSNNGFFYDLACIWYQPCNEEKRKKNCKQRQATGALPPVSSLQRLSTHVLSLQHSVVYKTLDRRHRPPARRRRRILWQIRPKVSETEATGTEISGRCFGGRLSHAHLDSSAKAPLPGCRSGRVRPDPRNGFMVLGQCNRAQHWSVFKDPRKVLPPKSFKEFADRLPSNLDAFRFNYSTLLFKSLTTGRWCWQIVVVLLVCATFKLHNKRSAARTTSCWSPRR